MTEMQKLAVMLMNARIPFQVGECGGEPRICYPDVEEVECDVICHSHSAGGQHGLLEIKLITEIAEEEVEICDDYLLAWDAFEYIYNHHEGRL